MHAISFSLSFMHDIAGYMLCSLELNMQALFVYTYLCVSERVQVGVCALFSPFIVLPHHIRAYVDVRFSTAFQEQLV